MEASILIDGTEEKWKQECGRIWLDFGSSGSDESTGRFLKLFGEHVPSTTCNKDEELKQGMAHIFDPNVPAPATKPCNIVYCIDCRRYGIIATFVGKLRYSAREKGHPGFGHLRMYDLQLDVKSVSNLEVTDTLAASSR
jgi:hypothetical protein